MKQPDYENEVLFQAELEALAKIRPEFKELPEDHEAPFIKGFKEGYLQCASTQELADAIMGILKTGEEQ